MSFAAGPEAKRSLSQKNAYFWRDSLFQQPHSPISGIGSNRPNTNILDQEINLSKKERRKKKENVAEETYIHPE